MAENFDEESMRNVNDALRSLAEQMAEFNRIMPNVITNMGKNNDSLVVQEKLAKLLGKSMEDLKKEIDEGLDPKKALIEAEEELTKRHNLMRNALNNGIQSVKGFGSALFDATTGLEKYSKGLNSLGDSALDMGMLFGRAGLAVGLFTKALTAVGSAALKQADAALKARDELVKIGNAGSITAKQTLEMGHAAGLTSKNLDLLIKPIQRSSEALATLSGTASEGTESFKGMVNVGENTRMAYRRLGLSVGELIDNQSQYLNLQKLSGSQLTARERTEAGLRAASLKYTDNLLTLANITGKNVDQIKKEQEMAAVNLQVQLKNLEINKKIRDAEEAGNYVLAAQLRKEQETRNEFIQGLASTTDPQTLAGMQQFLTTGLVTELVAPLRLAGISIEDFKRRIESGEDSAKVLADFQTEYARGIERNGLILQTSASVSEDAAKQFLLTTDSLQATNRILNKDQQAALAQSRENIEKGKKAGTDAAATTAAAIESSERLLQQGVDKLLLSVNPLFKSFEATTAAAAALATAAVVAAAALARMAAQAGLIGLPNTSKNVPDISKPTTVPDAGKTAPKAGSIRPTLGVGLAGAGVAIAGTAASQALGPETTGGKVASTLGYAGQGAALGTMLGPYGAAIGGAAGLLYGGYKALSTPEAEITPTAQSAKETTFQRELREAQEKAKEQAEKQRLTTEKNSQELNKNSKALSSLSTNVATANEKTEEQITPLLAGRNVGQGIAMSSEQQEREAAQQVDGQKPAGAETTPSPETILASQAAPMDTTGTAATYERIIDKDKAAGRRGREMVTDAKSLLLDKKAFSKTELIELYNQAAIKNDLKVRDEIKNILDEREELDSETSAYLKEINKSIIEYNNKLRPVVAAERKKLDDAAKKAQTEKDQKDRADKISLIKTGTVAPTTIGPESAGSAAEQGKGRQSLASGRRGRKPSETGSQRTADGDADTARAEPTTIGKNRAGPDTKILDFIGTIEGRGNYNILVGGKTKTDPPLTELTVDEVLDFQKQMPRSGFESSAVGKYQIIRKTLAGLVSSGVVNPNEKFDEATQDKAAIGLLKQRGQDRYRSGTLDVNSYANNLAKEWASLPMPDGKSFYAGVGSNKSLVSRDEFINALQAREGGIASGSEFGYPAMLHGTELISPLSPNSILEKLAQTPVSAAKTISETTSSFTSMMGNTGDRSLQDLTKINYDMMNMLSDKLDSMIDRLGDSNSIQEKILRQTTS